MSLIRTLRSLLLTLGVLTLGLPADADAAAILITPTVDRRGIFNFGLDDEFHLQIDGGPDTVTLQEDNFEERFALEFALGALPADAIITAVTLTLHLTGDPIPGANSAEVHGYAGDGTIQAADLSVDNLLAGFLPVAPSFDIALGTLFLQNLVLAGEDFAGFTLRNVTIGGGVFNVWSVEAMAANRPTLTVEYEVTPIPEPGTLVLLGTALAACGRRLHKRSGKRRAVCP
jgi:hypothetical protein